MITVSHRLHAKTIPDSIAEALDRLLDLVKRCRRVCRTEEHLVHFHTLLGVEEGAFHEQSAVVDVLEEQLVLNLVHGLLRVGGVFLVVDLHPMEHPRHRRDPADDIFGQMALASAQDGVAAGGVFHADVDEPVEVAGVAPVVFEQLVEHELADAAGVLRAYVDVCAVALADLVGGGDPADAGAGSDDFGEGVEAHHAAVDIEREEGRDEIFQELLVRCWRRHGRVGAGVGFHLQEVVRFVLEDVEVVLLRQGVNLSPSLGRLCRTGWILAGGYSVHYEWLGASFLVPVGEHVVERLRTHAVFVHWNGGNLHSKWSDCFNHRREGELLCQNPIARVAQHSERNIGGRCSTDGHVATPVLIRRIVHNLSVLNQPAQKLGRSMTKPILESSLNIEPRLALSNVVLACGQHFAMFVHILGGEFAMIRDLDAKLIEREVFARRQASTKRDQPRRLQILRGSLERVALPRLGLVRKAIYTLQSADAVTNETARQKRRAVDKATKKRTYNPIVSPSACADAASVP